MSVHVEGVTAFGTSLATRDEKYITTVAVSIVLTLPQ